MVDLHRVLRGKHTRGIAYKYLFPHLLKNDPWFVDAGQDFCKDQDNFVVPKALRIEQVCFPSLMRSASYAPDKFLTEQAHGVYDPHRFYDIL